MTDAPRRRPNRPQAVLEVLDRIQLSEHLVRIVAGGAGIEHVADNSASDKYAKLLFGDPDIAAPFDLDAIRASDPARLPARRTYSVLAFDREAQCLSLDFVTHGDTGIAGPWSAAAEAGDRVVLSGMGGGYTPNADAAWHLLVGDHSALPAIAQSLEALPLSARGVVVLELAEIDRIELQHPAGIDIRYVDPDPSHEREPLVDAVRGLEWMPGTPHAFVHGERGAIKTLRKHLSDERSQPRELLSISAYWARGRVEDEFQAEKREPIGQI